MSLRRRLVDGVRRRLVPAASELEELRDRLRTAETELAQARQRIRSLERQLDERDSQRAGVADALRATQAAPEPSEGAAPATGRLVIKAEDCVGCGTCVDLAPDAFQMNRAKAVAEVVSQDAPADQVEEAILACPTMCIHRVE